MNVATSDHSQPNTPGQARDHTATSTGGGFGGSPPRGITGGSPPRGITVFEDAVIEAVRSISVGDLMTYGEVAEFAGFPGRARGVGRVLAISAVDMPWWRVVGAGLRIISPSGDEQARLLQEEGWTVTGRRVADGTRTDRARPAN